MKILVIDDDGIFRKSLEHTLGKLGLTVLTASNASTAQQHLRSQVFDGVVCDINMPGIDGLSVVATLRRSGFRGSVVVVSSDTQAQSRDRALEAGASEFLSKPVNPMQVASLLRGQVSRSKKSGTPAP